MRVEDKDGNFCPTADNLVKFALDGPGKIAGVDNGNPATVEPFQADYRKAFNGLALLIVRGERGKPGHVKVTAYRRRPAGGRDYAHYEITYRPYRERYVSGI